MAVIVDLKLPSIAVLQNESTRGERHLRFRIRSAREAQSISRVASTSAAINCEHLVATATSAALSNLDDDLPSAAAEGFELLLRLSGQELLTVQALDRSYDTPAVQPVSHSDSTTPFDTPRRS